MKKVLISGLGLMVVSLIAMPAVAERGSGQEREGFKQDRAGQNYASRNSDRQALERDLNREQREYQRDQRHNVRAMKRADSPRERERIRHNMRADWRDYKHDVHQIKRNYRHQEHYYRHRPVIKHQHRGNADHFRSGHHRGSGPDHHAWGFRN